MEEVTVYEFPNALSVNKKKKRIVGSNICTGANTINVFN